MMTNPTQFQFNVHTLHFETDATFVKFTVLYLFFRFNFINAAIMIFHYFSISYFLFYFHLVNTV